MNNIHFNSQCVVLNSFKKIILQEVKLKKKKQSLKCRNRLKDYWQKERKKGRECVRMSERVFERGNIFANILPKPDFSILSPCR